MYAKWVFDYGRDIADKIKEVAIKTPLSPEEARQYILSGKTLEQFNPYIHIPLGRNAYGEIAINRKIR